jgi:hypothetical protein
MLGDMGVMESGLWFFSGALFYRFFSIILSNAYAFLLAQVTIDEILKLLFVTEESFKLVQEMKYDTARSTNYSSEDISKMREVDQLTLSTWQSLTISNLVYSSPKFFRGAIKFSNWSEAKDCLKKRGDNE